MIGSLKHRITFQILVTVINENGFEVSEWRRFNFKGWLNLLIR